MRFFFDNCIGICLVNGIRAFAEIQQYQLYHLSEKFDPKTPDVDWISALATEGDWVIISADPRISRGQAERNAWQESKLTAFFLGDGWASQSFWKQAECLVHWWPKIVLRARDPNIQTGSGFVIPLKGKDFKQIFPAQG